MRSRIDNTLHYSPLVIGCLLLTLLLSACGLGSGSSSSPSATPQSQSRATPGPSLLPTPAPAIGLRPYNGSGYTISYPQDWTKHVSGGSVVFAENTRAATAAIQFGGTQSASSLVQSTMYTFQMRGKNYHKVNVASPVLVGGDNWNQFAATEDVVKSGQTVNVKLVILADQHHTNTASARTYTISFLTNTAFFDKANHTTFQPMLQTFKFTV